MSTYFSQGLRFEGLESRLLLAGPETSITEPVIDIASDEQLVEDLKAEVFIGDALKVAPSDGKIVIPGSGELVWMSDPDLDLDGVWMIDICGCGSNTLLLDAQRIGESCMQGTLDVVSNADDVVKFDAGWQFTTAQAAGEKIVRQFQNKDAVLNLTGPNDFTNPLDVYDVNGSGDVTSLDVLVGVNELSARRFSDRDEGTIGDVATMDFDRFNFYDVSGNHRITAIDSLRVINEMARRSNARDAATEQLAPLEVLASDALIVKRVSSVEEPTLKDGSQALVSEAKVGVTNDRSMAQATNEPVSLASLSSTAEESPLSESLVDSVFNGLDPTLEFCLEPDPCAG